MDQMKPTMSDVAKAVGVSRTTVSRVISGKSSHSEETRAKIMSMIKEMNYSPNLLAQAVKNGKTGNIGVIITNEHVQGPFNPFYIPTLEAIIEGAKQNGYGLYIMTDQDIETPTAKALIERQIDGVILISTVGDSVIERFYQQDIPVVLVNHVTRYQNIPYIIFDEFDGAYQGIKHLLSNGHRRILFLGGHLITRCYIRRYEAFIAALNEAGIAPDPHLILFGSWNYQTGYEMTKNFLSSGKELPTVVFASNDMMGIGAYKALYEAGISVPGQIELMGFDDIEYSKLMIPSLSTVHVPKEQMGVKAVQVLKALMEGKEITEKEILLPTSLVIRESCR